MKISARRRILDIIAIIGCISCGSFLLGFGLVCWNPWLIGIGVLGLYCGFYSVSKEVRWLFTKLKKKRS